MDSNSITPYTAHEQLLITILQSKRSFVVMGKLLRDLRENDNFREVVGEGIDTWNAYLAQPEIGLSKGEADRLIQIYEEFVLRFGVDEEYLATVPVKNLHYLLPIAKESDNAEEVNDLVVEAANLSQRDFRERIHDIRSGESATRTYEFMVMKKCLETGSMQKVHDISSELIIETFNLHTNV